jgi:putative DNA primase/helicase
MPSSDFLNSPAARSLHGGAYAQSTPDDAHVDDDSPDTHRNAPRPDPVCLYGLVGDVARAGSEDTEANPYAIAANFMAYLSCAIGRGPYLPVGNTWHHARLFILHIGRSGRGRKGDAVSLVNRLDTALRQLREGAAPPVHRGGLSSREGLVSLFHDGYKQGKLEVPAIEDKRLWVVESEFANVLHQGRREGNTLSAALRDCWDGVCLKPATKSNRLYASHPHLCLSGAISPSELLALMRARELTNGFANRFLMLWAEREKVVPFPTATPQDSVDALAVRMLDVLDFVQAERVTERDHMRIELTAQAQGIYSQLYRGELIDDSAGERVTALLERRAPMLLRLAMIFALCDLQTQINEQHIQAAMGWIRHGVESAKFVFVKATDAADSDRTNAAVKRIVDFLRVKGTATRWQITAECFQGHASKATIDAAIERLLLASPPQITVQPEPRIRGARGRQTNIYALSVGRSVSAIEK